MSARIGSRAVVLGAALALAGCATTESTSEASPPSHYLAPPLVSEYFTADPSAHVWEDGRIYVYTSHDVDNPLIAAGGADAFDMRDYLILSMDEPGGAVTVHPPVLNVDSVPWASRQMWAPDAAYRDGTYYLYFPAKDENDVFRIGVATSSSPTGPFTAQPQPMRGSYSIDPAVMRDADGEHYMYIGGIWGGQLQRWQSGAYDPTGPDQDDTPPDDPAIAPVVARLAPSMLEFAEEPRRVQILDPDGSPITAGDHDRRFFEGAWVFRRGDTYYFTYSTGDTHYLVYATGTSPYGPFTYRGRILEPVEGWTTHHSIVEVDGAWYLFYHDTQLSGGVTHLRNVKMTPLEFRADGSIVTIDPMPGD
ncbi:MAG: glycoside hydrolase family 43 protein [Erythrobacter sp.]|nr:MAG: glycoside hydrolase family 43 protein [Erythrobacter sp.]